MDVYDKIYYSEDNNENILDNGDLIETDEEFLIPQLDGANEDESDQHKEIVDKSMFSISCEINEIHLLLNFFRSFDLLWKPTNNHPICKYDQNKNCFFCHLRSSCQRLNSKRTRGPRSLKLVEFTSQLNQYQDYLGWNWRTNISDLDKFIHNSLKLLDKDEDKIASLIGFPEGQCQQCLKCNPVSNKLSYKVETGHLEQGITSIKDLLRHLILDKGNNECCFESMKLNNSEERIVIFTFSHPVNIKTSPFEEMWGGIFKYISHTDQTEKSNCSYFKNEDKILYQNSNGDICQSNLNIHRNVSNLAFSVHFNERKLEVIENLVYDGKIQLYLRKHYLSVLCPEKHQERKEREKNYENVRSRDESRQAYKRSIDQVRDKSETRKARDQTSERKKRHTNFDQ